ncbi:MAG: rhodanese-like domain-containing protein [Cyanobacteria bacterium P01_D01_bin.115]
MTSNGHRDLLTAAGALRRSPQGLELSRSMSFIYSPLRALAWLWVKRYVRRQFPDAPRLTTDELAMWLASDRPPPLLIDVRKTDEYHISHLPDAQHLPTLATIQQAPISPEATVILYCSVGYRSARLVQQLQTAGYSSVFNLEGSIFEWYNRGYSVVSAQAAAPSIHPYNRIWGLLLKD